MLLHYRLEGNIVLFTITIYTILFYIIQYVYANAFATMLI